MTSLNLATQLSGHVFAYILIFTRIGAAMTLFPGFGESFVAVRMRLSLSLAVSFILLTPLFSIIPRMPSTPDALVAMFFHEFIIGIFYGSLLRLLMDVLETTGSVIAMQIGLSSAMMLNPTQGTQSTLPSSFLTIAGLVLLFVSGLDHLLIRGLVDTYNLFPPGTILPTGDMVQSYTSLLMKAFALGTELAAPLLLVGLLMFGILGFIQRLMPQVQLFLVTMPAQIWGGLFILSVTLSIVMATWLRFFNDSFGTLFSR